MTVLQKDLRSAALIANLPNRTGGDYYLGVSVATSGMSNATLIPGIRMSIYPNSGYSLWTQFAKWPDVNPNFSVGTGIQVEFPAGNSAIRQAIGLSWNKIYGDAYSQRDISAHGLYGWDKGTLGYGLMASLDMHHVLIDNKSGFVDYDETFIQTIPYITWMVTEQTKLSLAIPLDVEGAALDMSCEILFGKRK